MVIYMSIEFIGDGYVHCISVWGEYSTCFDRARYTFDRGITLLNGDVDSGAWGISYLLSMYDKNNKSIVLFKPELYMDGIACEFGDIKEKACYMDPSNPLFNKELTVREMVEMGLSKNHINMNVEEILEKIPITPCRFERKLSGVGNERFRCMAAIGYANKKTIYCFPWMSKNRFIYYHRNLTDVLNILGNMNNTVLMPTNLGELPDVTVSKRYIFS